MSEQSPPGAGHAREVVTYVDGPLGCIVLNRPHALNSLNAAMVAAISDALSSFERMDRVGCVVITAAERGFCAGGDIRALRESAIAADGVGKAFLADEYALNARISAFEKPIVAVMDGIVMGGGIGLAGHAAVRIVTERSRVAMPEVGIGFVPDVGGTWLLTRELGELGSWLALTGQTVEASDAIAAGLADRYVPSERLPELLASLRAACQFGGPDLGRLLAPFWTPPPGGLVRHHAGFVDEHFAGDSALEIVRRLERSAASFAQETAATIRRRSPTSVAVALRLLREARRDDNLVDALRREFHAACRTMDGEDFCEGIRAAIVDKDRNPRWSPPTLEMVDPEVVSDHFVARAPDAAVFAARFGDSA